MKTCTYLVTCSITMQHTFTEAELERIAPGDASELTPTPAALRSLAAEIEAVLGEQYAVSSCSMDSESTALLGSNSN